jgi:hypothetical protein
MERAFEIEFFENNLAEKNIFLCLQEVVGKHNNRTLAAQSVMGAPARPNWVLSFAPRN